MHFVDHFTWFESFFLKHTQLVKHDNFISDNNGFISTFQEDHLSQLFLLLLFISDINNDLKRSNFLILADDLKLFDKFCHQNDTILLQNDLNAFQKW